MKRSKTSRRARFRLTGTRSECIADGKLMCRHEKLCIWLEVMLSKTLHFVRSGACKNLAFRDGCLTCAAWKLTSYVDKPYLLWMKDRKTQDGVEYLPIYMVSCLAE